MKNRIANHYTYQLDAIAEHRYPLDGLPFTKFEAKDNAFRNDPYEHPVGPSLTVPNMTLSLDELLKRYVRGENVTVFEPQFTDDPDLDGYDRMNTMEKIEAADDIRRGISDFQQRRASEKSERKKADEIAIAATKAAEIKTDAKIE